MDGRKKIGPGSRSAMIRQLGLEPRYLRKRGGRRERQVQRVAVTETASSRGNQGGDLPATSTTPGS